MYWGSQTNSVLKFQILSNINIYWKNPSLRYGIYKADGITIGKVMIMIT